MPLHRLKPNGTVSNTGWTVTGASAHAAVNGPDHPALPTGSTSISTVSSAGDTIVFDLDTDAMTSNATLCVLRVYVTSTAGWALDAAISGNGGASWETVQSQSGSANSWIGFAFRTSYSSLASVQVQLTGYGDDVTQDTTVEAVELRVVEAGTAINTGTAPFLSGLVLLMEASAQGDEAGGGLADGTALGVISDSSGAENHGISTGINRPAYYGNVHNGHPALRFVSNATGNPDNQWFDLPDLLSGSAAGEIFIVLKTSIPGVAFPPYGAWHFGTDGADNTHFDYHSVGEVYDSFGNTARNHWTDGGGEITASHWLIYNVYSAAGDWQAFVNNVSSFSTGTNTVGWNNHPTFGRSRDDIGFDGDVAAIAIYNRKLTGTERGNVYAYLLANDFNQRAGGAYFRRYILPRGIRCGR